MYQERSPKYIPAIAISHVSWLCTVIQNNTLARVILLKYPQDEDKPRYCQLMKNGRDTENQAYVFSLRAHLKSTELRLLSAIDLLAF